MQTMRFEGRELTPYSVPVSASDLKAESTYFFVNFVDDAMLLPTVEPVVYIGRNLEANDAGVIYFQDIDSYQQGVRYDSTPKSDDAMFYTGPENETGHVFEYDHALEELMRCSLRRRAKGTA